MFIWHIFGKNIEIMRLEDIKKEEVDYYRGTENGTVIYLLNGDRIDVKESFEEVDDLFNL